MVVETARAEKIPIGTPLLAIPTHVCPTVALHRRAYVVEDGQVVGQWEVTARDRVLGIYARILDQPRDGLFRHPGRTRLRSRGCPSECVRSASGSTTS